MYHEPSLPTILQLENVYKRRVETVCGNILVTNQEELVKKQKNKRQTCEFNFSTCLLKIKNILLELTVAFYLLVLSLQDLHTFD